MKTTTHFWLNKVFSRKFFMFLFSAGFCYYAFHHMLKMSYTLPADVVKQLSTLYATFMGTFGLLCATYMGANITEAKFNNLTNIIGKVETKFEEKNININEHVIEEGGEGAPEVRPWSQHATEDHEHEEDSPHDDAG